MPRAPVIRTPFTDRDKTLIRALAPNRINYFPGSSAKRFARTLNHDLEHRETLGMTDKQRAYMAELAYKHRGQLPKALQPPSRPSIEEIEFYRDFHDELADVSHLAPSEADLDELAALKREVISVDDFALTDQLELL
jgi:hypothetical protein